MNCAIQSTPNPLRWATSSVIVCTGGARCAPTDHASVTATEIVDRARPANAKAQKGSTSRQGSLAPVRPQVHRRFRQYDGILATVVAITLAIHAVTPNAAVAVASVNKLMTVVTTETLMHRVSRWSRLRDREPTYACVTRRNAFMTNGASEERRAGVAASID